MADKQLSHEAQLFMNNASIYPSCELKSDDGKSKNASFSQRILLHLSSLWTRI